jgi:hypothetical protein
VLTRVIEVSPGWFFRLFNRTFDLGLSIYVGIVERLQKHRGIATTFGIEDLSNDRVALFGTFLSPVFFSAIMKLFGTGRAPKW